MSYPQPYLDFLAHANDGRYREALLRLEELWFEDRSEFYAGLLQLMVALNQLKMGMAPERTLRRAGERLAPFAPRYRGLDVAYLLDFIERCRALLPTAGEPGLRGEVPSLELELLEP